MFEVTTTYPDGQPHIRRFNRASDLSQYLETLPHSMTFLINQEVTLCIRENTVIANQTPLFPELIFSER